MDSLGNAARAPAGGMFHDYNLRAKAFWWTVVVLGGSAIAHSLYTLTTLPLEAQGVIALGITLVAITGVFPFDLRSVHTLFASGGQLMHALQLDRKRGDRIEYSLGDFYTLLLLFAHGVPAATIAYAVEAFVGSRRTSRRRSSWIAGPTIAGVAMYSCGYAFLHVVLPLIKSSTNLRFTESVTTVVVAASLFAVVLYVVDVSLTMIIPLLKQKTLPAMSIIVGNFTPTAIWTVFSAGFAALLAFEFRDDLVMVMLYSAVPFALAFLGLHRFAQLQDAYLVANEAQRQRFQSLFNDAAIGMAVLARDGTIQEVNAAFSALFGCDADSLASRSFAELVDPEEVDTWTRVLRRTQGDHFSKFSLDLRCRHSSESTRWITLHISASSEITGATGLILQAEDSTSRVQTTRDLDHLAHHDSLTGLPNRRRFTQLLNDAVATARATPAAGYAVLYLDFDGFKRINDTLGHAAGDRFLVAMAQRIRASVRPMDVVARLGGDEFAVLLPLRMPEEEADARVIADRIAQALAQPHPEQGNILHGHASIGIVTSTRGYAAETDVMRDADLAMYASKSLSPR